MTDGEVVKVLKDLVRSARDGEYGFLTCAEQVKAARLQTVFF